MKKQKIASLALAVVMAVSLSVPAFAEETADTSPTHWGTSDATDGTNTVNKTTDTSNAASFDVTASASKDKDDTGVYKVGVEWTVTSGNDGKASTYKWSPADLRYVKQDGTTTSSGTATPASVSITLTNSSNKTVYYKMAYAPYEDTKTVEGAESKIKISQVASGSDSATGSVESADKDITSWSTQSGTAQTATYNAKVEYINDYDASTNNGIMGTYTVNLNQSSYD